MTDQLVQLVPGTTSMEVLIVTVGAVYLRLPRELQRDAGTCQCQWCKGESAKWDTLVVLLTPGTHTYTVHCPDGQVEQLREYLWNKDRNRSQRSQRA